MPAKDRPRERGIWYDIKQRCYNPNNKSYKSYGGKGVKVCEEWLDDFEAFYSWFLKASQGNYGYLKLKEGAKIFSPETCYVEITKVLTLNNKNTLVGKRFGKLNVTSFAKKTTLFGKEIFVWNCQCDCGKVTTAIEPNLLSHKVTSCGCNFAKYEKDPLFNYKKERIYEIYRGMISRCYDIRSDHYKYYGAMGIAVCDEWHFDAEQFIVWALDNGYEIGLSIERKDITKGYNPENCTWIDKQAQAKNKSTNVFIQFKDRTHYLAEWARLLKMDAQVAKTYLLAHGGVIVQNPNIDNRDVIEVNTKAYRK